MERGGDPASASRSRFGHRTHVLIGVVALVAVLVIASVVTLVVRTDSAPKPNIVFILTDDLSSNLITPQITPHIYALEHQGETFTNYYVADSLCCPSRATIFTGLFPHDTKVTTNLPPNGGYPKFVSEGDTKKTFAVALQGVGYKTALLGKYLNGYGDTGGSELIPPSGRKDKMTKAKAPVPPGWNDWHVSNNTGYQEFNYWQNDNGAFNFYKKGIGTYGVDVANRYAQSFIEKNAHTPFMLEVATFAPHPPSTPAPRNAKDFRTLTQPHDVSFNAQNINPPDWLGQRAPMTPIQQLTTDAEYRQRAQATESVDKLLADTEATLKREGIAKSTYIVFSSDNGYHLGQHRILDGKETAFDTDIKVPLIVAGPGVPHGKVVPQVAQNIDLCPTFEQLGGAPTPTSVEGHSLVSLLHPSGTAPQWRTVALLEHHGETQPGDPDFQGAASNPPTYNGIRIQAQHLAGFSGPVDATWVEYGDAKHEIEYYNDTKDPYQVDNIAGTLTKAQRASLHKVLEGLHHCHSGTACWQAGLPQ